jgi:hypothetical protein
MFDDSTANDATTSDGERRGWELKSSEPRGRAASRKKTRRESLTRTRHQSKQQRGAAQGDPVGRARLHGEQINRLRAGGRGPRAQSEQQGDGAQERGKQGWGELGTARAQELHGEQRGSVVRAPANREREGEAYARLEEDKQEPSAEANSTTSSRAQNSSRGRRQIQCWELSSEQGEQSRGAVQEKLSRPTGPGTRWLRP